MAVMNAGSSDEAPWWGRKYIVTPALVDAWRVLTCRPMLRSADHPFFTTVDCS